MTKSKILLVVLLLVLPFNLWALTLNVKDYGAKGNGVTDDTKAFQLCIDKLRDNGGGTMEVPKGNYPISFLKFFGKNYSNITILGENATILQRIVGSRKSAENNKFKTFAQRHAADGCFVFDAQVSKQKDDSQSIKNIKISGLNFVSDVERHGFDELLHQISAHGVSNFTVENCAFTGFLGDGIAINGGTDFSKFHDAYNKDVVIRNCKFDGINRNNRQAISIYYSDGFLIDKCSFRNTTRDDMPGAIDIEPDREINVVRNGVISNCSFYNIGGLGAVSVIQTHPLPANAVLITNCDFEKVKAPLAVIGTPNFLRPNKGAYEVLLKDSRIKESQAVADFRFASNVFIGSSNFQNITTKTFNNVSAVGVNNVRFETCVFNDVSHVDGLTFTGASKNIDFLGCHFLNFQKQAITINDPGGIGTISNNYFASTRTPNSFPLITGRIKNRRLINQNLLLGNRSSGNFVAFTVKPFFSE